MTDIVPQKVVLCNSSCPTKFSDGHVGHWLGDWSRNEGPPLHLHGTDNSNNFLPLIMLSAGLWLETTYLQLPTPTRSWISVQTLYTGRADFFPATIVESDHIVVCLRLNLSSVCRTWASWAPVDDAQSSKWGIKSCSLVQRGTLPWQRTPECGTAYPPL